MRRLGLLGLGLLVLGCAGLVPPAMEIEVVPTRETREMLHAKGERIAVTVTFADEGMGDDGKYLDHQDLLGSDGGVVAVPIDVVDQARSQGLTEVSVSIYSAREADENNVLFCDPWFGQTDALPERVLLLCNPL